MSLPEDIANDLNSKVQRINMLQKLVLQEKINLGAKALGRAAADEVDLINEQVRKFLYGLLEEELGGSTHKDPVARPEPDFDPFSKVWGIEMTEEKAQALDSLLNRLVAKTETPPPPVQSAPVQRVAPDGKRILSPVLAALKDAAGGEEEWMKLPPDERMRRVKELERQSAINYTPTK